MTGSGASSRRLIYLIHQPYQRDGRDASADAQKTSQATRYVVEGGGADSAVISFTGQNPARRNDGSAPRVAYFVAGRAAITGRSMLNAISSLNGAWLLHRRIDDGSLMAGAARIIQRANGRFD